MYSQKVLFSLTVLLPREKQLTADFIKVFNNGVEQTFKVSFLNEWTVHLCRTSTYWQ